ncbi:MAG: hypothetical protein JWN24_2539 [Phycisphaerales bacterium]|nr:hypothetical protein [Phycisphaerales bacterium]
MRPVDRTFALCLIMLLSVCSYTLGADGDARVHGVKIVADKAPDCSSLKSIVQSVTRDCKTNDEKGITLYNFMQMAHYHQGYPAEKGGLGALKEINVYGWSLCGGLHTVEAALWREAGWKWRYVGWSDPGHTTVEAFYDGRWHYFDVFLRFYTWMPDAASPGGRTVAGEMDIKANPALVTEGLTFDKARGVYYHSDNLFENINGKANWTAPCFLDCGDEPPAIITGIKSCDFPGSPTGWAGLEFDSPGYSTDVNLAPGYSLELMWSAIDGAHWWNGPRALPAHTCSDKDYRNCPAIGPVLEPYRNAGAARSYANGRLVFAPDLGNPAFLASFAARDNVKVAGGQLVPADPSRAASVTVELRSPYLISRASGKVEGADAAELSVDDGKTFQPIDLADFSKSVGGSYGALVRLSFKSALKSLRLEAIVQHNRCALPYLSPGKNRITVSAADAEQLGDGSLVITYAYETGSRNKSYEELADAGAEIAKGHGATWSPTPTVVQKVLHAADLPATFEIDVPTPRGKYPVYPRMLFLRREVIPAGGKPMPLPAGSTEPKLVAGDELKTLPNPFTIGIAMPPKVDTRGPRH